MALAALGGGIAGGLAPGGELGGAKGLFGGGTGVAKVAGEVARGVVGNVAMQGVAVATGLQSKFDWAGVAAAGVTAGLGNQIGGNTRWARTGASFASGIAGAAAASLVTGRDFGDTIMSQLPSIIANTIGNLVSDAVAGRGRSGATGTAASSTTVGEGGDQTGDIVVTARRTSSFNYVDYFPQVTTALMDYDARAGDAGYIAARQQQRVTASLAQQIIDGTKPSSLSSAATANQKISYDGGVYDGQTSEGQFTDNSYVYNQDTETIDYYELTAGNKAVRKVDPVRTQMLRDGLSELNWGVGGFVLGAPAVGGLIAGGVVALPGALMAGRGFLYANALRISIAGQFGTDMVAGTQVGTSLPIAAGVTTASLAAAESEIAQVTLNRAKGLAFEDAGIRGILSHVGLGKNTTAITRNGVTTILDASGRPAGLVEFKDVVNLSSSPQLRAQLAEALATRQPYNLVVSPGNQSISRPLLEQTRAVNRQVGGGVYRYDPATDILTPFGK